MFQHLHLSHADTEKVIAAPEVDFVSFTGSVAGGEMVERAATGRFIGVGLELGGKDPAYVRNDAGLMHAVENVVDGAFFNSGQSCCGIERVYVQEALYDAFVEAAADLVGNYKTGATRWTRRPRWGPLVRASAADFVRAQTAEAVAAGARPLVDAKGFAADAEGTPYLAPQVLVDVDHSMRVMHEETFGPVVGIMKVGSDDEAIELMNDSPYGAHRLGLDAGRGGGAVDRQPGRHRHLVHEPLRLSGPGAGLDRRQAVRSRLQPVGAGL